MEERYTGTAPQDGGQGLAVRPTVQAEGQHYSDIALTGLFNAHVQLFIQEVQGLWQRFNIMLLANTVVLGFFTRAGDRGQIEVWSGTLFGLLLCAAWAAMLAERKFKRHFCTGTLGARPLEYPSTTCRQIRV